MTFRRAGHHPTRPATYPVTRHRRRYYSRRESHDSVIEKKKETNKLHFLSSDIFLTVRDITVAIKNVSYQLIVTDRTVVRFNLSRLS